jgi:outer membrane protein OmpA-like peptidoglycan-associated protein
MALVAASGCDRRQQDRQPTEPGAMKPMESQPGVTAPTAPGAPGQTAPGQTAPGAPGQTGPGATGQTGPGAPGTQGTDDPDLAILTITAVDVDTKLAAMCGLPDTKVHFKFDSANLSADAKAQLDRIATCVTTGAAKGRELRIVGRTDPVGPDAYNQQLGKSRAAAVGEYLRGQGVQAQRVEIESKGEQDASAHPLRWPEERRVTIRLQE